MTATHHRSGRRLSLCAMSQTLLRTCPLHHRPFAAIRLPRVSSSWKGRSLPSERVSSGLPSRGRGLTCTVHGKKPPSSLDECVVNYVFLIITGTNLHCDFSLWVVTCGATYHSDQVDEHSNGYLVVTDHYVISLQAARRSGRDSQRGRGPIQARQLDHTPECVISQYFAESPQMHAHRHLPYRLCKVIVCCGTCGGHQCGALKDFIACQQGTPPCILWLLYPERIYWRHHCNHASDRSDWECARRTAS